MSGASRRIATVVVLVAAVLVGGTGGCVSYQFGAASMYPLSIRTIYVPVPRNDTYRHDLGIQLAEALVREIETQTPYKVIGNASADSVLTCRVTGQTKTTLTEVDSDDPRALDLNVSVTAAWNDRLGNDLFQNAMTRQIEGQIVPARFADDRRFVPEAGQSVQMAGIEVAQSLAKQIVAEMQARW